MNGRRSFLASTMGGIAAASVFPDVVRAQTAVESKPGEPKIVSDGQGTQVWAMGVLVTVKVTAADTGGAYSVFEDLIPPGAGPVPHTHTKEDETIFVLEGKLRAWLGGKQYDVQTGDFVHMPRGVQHYFRNVSEAPTRLLLTYTPVVSSSGFSTSENRPPPILKRRRPSPRKTSKRLSPWPRTMASSSASHKPQKVVRNRFASFDAFGRERALAVTELKRPTRPSDIGVSDVGIGP